MYLWLTLLLLSFQQCASAMFHSFLSPVISIYTASNISYPKKFHDKHLYRPVGELPRNIDCRVFPQIIRHVHASSQQLPDSFPEWWHRLALPPAVLQSSIFYILSCTITSLLTLPILWHSNTELRVDGNYLNLFTCECHEKGDALEKLCRNDLTCKTKKMQHERILWEV